MERPQEIIFLTVLALILGLAVCVVWVIFLYYFIVEMYLTILMYGACLAAYFGAGPTIDALRASLYRWQLRRQARKTQAAALN